MNSIRDYIISESIDDDNLSYKIDAWFERDPDGKSKLYGVIRDINLPGAPKKTIIDDYIKSSNINLKAFIDFIVDNIYTNEVNDYTYVFGKALELMKNKIDN
ncbi:MAG: hypothetical protein J6D03_05905 [Clostridia bacterium]|nr:hypothetical protein [Clostridia bacterium]